MAFQDFKLWKYVTKKKSFFGGTQSKYTLIYVSIDEVAQEITLKETEKSKDYLDRFRFDEMHQVFDTADSEEGTQPPTAYGFCISDGMSKVWNLFAENKEDHSDWVRKINLILSKLKKIRSLSEDSKSYAPQTSPLLPEAPILLESTEQESVTAGRKQRRRSSINFNFDEIDGKKEQLVQGANPMRSAATKRAASSDEARPEVIKRMTALNNVSNPHISITGSQRLKKNGIKRTSAPEINNGAAVEVTEPTSVETQPKRVSASAIQGLAPPSASANGVLPPRGPVPRGSPPPGAPPSRTVGGLPPTGPPPAAVKGGPPAGPPPAAVKGGPPAGPPPAAVKGGPPAGPPPGGPRPVVSKGGPPAGPPPAAVKGGPPAGPPPGAAKGGPPPGGPPPKTDASVLRGGPPPRGPPPTVSSKDTSDSIVTAEIGRVSLSVTSAQHAADQNVGTNQRASFSVSRLPPPPALKPPTLTTGSSILPPPPKLMTTAPFPPSSSGAMIAPPSILPRAVLAPKSVSAAAVRGGGRAPPPPPPLQIE